MEQSASAFIAAGLAQFASAVHDRGSDLRNIQLATVTPEGQPDVRTLVVRGFDRSQASLEMHSDRRACKVQDIEQASAVAVLAWSSADQLQLRFKGAARLHHGDPVAHARWDALSPNARNAYGLRSDPGRPIENPADQSHLPPEQQFQQFVVILVSLVSVDMLRLGPGGQQTRAIGRFAGEDLDARWIGA